MEFSTRMAMSDIGDALEYWLREFGEAHLLEVMIEGEGLYDSAVPHDHIRNTVCE